MTMGKRLFIFGLLLTIVTAVWAQEPTQTTLRADSATRAVSRSGKAGTGCDTAWFVTRKGETFLARKAEIDTFPRENRRVARTGQLLTFDIQVLDSILECGRSDEEALVEITISWNYDYMPKIIERGVLYRKEGSTNLKTARDVQLKKEDCGAGTFQILLDTLDPGAVYETWAYAITIARDTFLSPKQFVTQNRSWCEGLVPRANEETDADGNVNLVRDHEGNPYRVVQIGSQCWTKENMRCSTSPPPRYPQDSIKPAQYLYTTLSGNDKYEVSYNDPYYYSYDALHISLRQRGYLYNWPAAVDTFGTVTELPQGRRRGICPEGWHVPDTHEWYEMVQGVLSGLEYTSFEQFYSSTGFQGDSVVKLVFGCDWPDRGNSYPGGYMDNPVKRNSSHFTALPTSNVQDTGTLGWTKKVSNFWLATPGSTTTAYSWHIDDDKTGVSSYPRTRVRGFSVRCLRNPLNIVSNLNSRVCLPSEATYSIADEGLNTETGLTFAWYVNGVLQHSESNICHYTHTVARQDTIKCHVSRTGVPGLPNINLWDSIYYLPKFPSIVLCRDAIGINGFVIKGSNNLHSAKWYNYSNNVLISEESATGKTIPIDPSGSYYIVMTDREGCKDTLKNISKITPKIGCKIWNQPKIIERLRDGESDIIDSVLDHEDNRYAVVQIGGQCWLRENMRATTSPSGHRIITKNNTIYSYPLKAAHWYKNDSATYNRFGVLYNWNAAVDSFNTNLPNTEGSYVDVATTTNTNTNNSFNLKFSGNRRGICPEGWHVPTDDEWMSLETFVNGGTLPLANVASTPRGNHAGKLSAGSDWKIFSDAVQTGAPSDFNNPNRNSSGFSAIPAGWCNPSSSSNDIDAFNLAIFWSATESAKHTATSRAISYNKAGVEQRPGQYKYKSMSVRCVRDFDFDIALEQLPYDNCTVNFTVQTTAGEVIPNYEGLSYQWKLNDVIQDVNNDTLQISLDSTNNLEVSCSVYLNGMEIASKSKKVEYPSNWPFIKLCENVDGNHVYSITIKSISNNVSSVVWRNSNNEVFYNGTTNPPSTNGPYTVILTNSDNCRAIQHFNVHTTCTVASIKPNESGNYTTIDSVQDIEGNWYRVVQVGGKCWLRENMRTTKAQNGRDLLFKNKDGNHGATKGIVSTTDSCYYDYASTGIPIRQRGYLYNYKAAKSVCPDGWRLPTEAEWFSLVYNGADTSKTCMLASSCYWKDNPTSTLNAPGNYDAENRNISGFSLVPAGNLLSANDGQPADFNYSVNSTITESACSCKPNSANFWTSRRTNDYNYYRVAFDNFRNTIQSKSVPIQRGMSVRCIRQ